MRRKFVKIDEDKCNGCGDCVPSCAEGAIKIIDGKARLVGESLCDGFGACLGTCPQGAITIEEREAEPFDELAVQDDPKVEYPACPGSLARNLDRIAGGISAQAAARVESQLSNWPVQLKLAPPSAKYFENADLLICADCVPFTAANFHQDFLKGKVLLVGCPRLDDLQFYFDKLKLIFANAKPRSLMVIRMEVPCCFGIIKSVEEARNQTIPGIPIEAITISLKGKVLDKLQL